MYIHKPNRTCECIKCIKPLLYTVYSFSMQYNVYVNV